MDRNIFAADTIPGSPSTQGEVKTLICFLLSEIDDSVSFSQLHRTFEINGLVNYFELVDNLSALVKSNHISIHLLDDIKYYKVKPLGRQAAKTLDNSLPLTVKEKALSTLNQNILKDNRLKELTAEIIHLSTGGYQLTLAIPETDGNLVSISLFCPTIGEAKEMRKTFINDPIFIYKAIVAILSGNKDILGELRPSGEKLFQ